MVSVSCFRRRRESAERLLRIKRGEIDNRSVDSVTVKSVCDGNRKVCSTCARKQLPRPRLLDLRGGNPSKNAIPTRR